MFRFYDSALIARNRQHFIESGKLIDTQIQDQIPLIYHSWVRSKKFCVNPNQAKLALPAKNVAKHDKYRYNINSQIIENMNKIANTCKIAMLILDEHLNVILLEGNVQLLETLRTINICIGTCFAEQVIGTNAAALALHSNDGLCVIGGQHYLEALQDYVTCARMFKSEKGNSKCIMLIAAKSDFHPSMPGLLYYHLISDNLNFAFEQKKLECTMLEKFIREVSTEEILCVDPRGVILYVSDWLANNIGLPKESIIGHMLENIFPELLEHIENVSDTGRSFVTKVYLSNAGRKKRYYVKIQSVSRDNVKAIILVFTENHHNEKAVCIDGFKARYTFADLIGNSKAFQETVATAKRAAMGSSNILIEGETGTGKELFAQALHNAGRRKDRPFISLNCAAIPRELIASELFGYEEGAFTGARKGGSIGKFEMAHKGTIFLDEIGEMPLDMQSVLLRVLEQKEITKLGGSRSIPIDVRIIAATNKDLQIQAQRGEFRMDLYYRMNVINLKIPPLRDRQEDIHLLVNYFVEKGNDDASRKIDFAPDVMHLFGNYSWPGNVRELSNVVESSINLCDSSVITIQDLPKSLVAHQTAVTPKSFDDKLFSQQEYDYYERQMIWQLMKECNGNKSEIAKRLRISRPTLYNKLKKFNIKDK
jgi:transcriptional regulator with PAS, ATPase and Fis domain